MASKGAAPRDSATVLLLRDGPMGLEVYMVRRHGRSAFMADAHVFPGGVIEPEDRSPAVLARVAGRTAADAARVLGEPDPSLALGLHVTAVRETFEEAGILLGAVGDTGPALARARRGLLDGQPFASVLQNLDTHVELDRLVPHSRWITPEVEPRRYDARFFLAIAPPDQTATHDQVETTAGRWTRPEVALAEAREGHIRLAPPTMRSLETLTEVSTADEALKAAGGHSPTPVTPVLREIHGELVLCLPGDPEHPQTERALTGSTRMALVDGRWWSR